MNIHKYGSLQNQWKQTQTKFHQIIQEREKELRELKKAVETLKVRNDNRWRQQGFNMTNSDHTLKLVAF